MRKTIPFELLKAAGAPDTCRTWSNEKRDVFMRRFHMRERYKATERYRDRVRAQAGFTTRECEQLMGVARKHGKTFEEAAAAARQMRSEFG